MRLCRQADANAYRGRHLRSRRRSACRQSVNSEVASPESPTVFETLNVSQEGAVLFADIAAPSMNLLGPALVRDLVSLIQQSETNSALKVLVFRSSVPDFFISHVDVTKIKEYRHEAAIALLFRYLSASRLVTIAQIEGRVRIRFGENWVRKPTLRSAWTRPLCRGETGVSFRGRQGGFASHWLGAGFQRSQVAGLG